jgi:pimeloyl-ACP methyl ester carboxylesterase
MYYEIHGPAVGVPLVLFHGGGSTIDVTWGRLLPLLARHRTVIALEEQGHGRTTDRDAPVRFDTSADDVAAALATLQVARADVMGFSNGASVALRLAIHHPATVRKLIFASSFTKRSGAAAEIWGFIANATFEAMPQPLKDAFLKVNPDPVKLRTMHDKDLERMRHFADTADEEVRQVQAPTLVIAGDHDVSTREHALELQQLFPHASLLMVPGGHGEYLGELLASGPDAPEPTSIAGMIEAFLGGA